VWRFLADCNVGRLARWLRALGYDADYEALLPDPQIVARALAEGRVLLSRDAGMMRRRVIADGSVRAILLRDDRVEGQLRQVISDLGLEVGRGSRALTRCLACNLELEPRLKSLVLDRLPPHVRMTQSRFSQCPSCSRVYWPGTHWARMHERIAALCA
jgi:uncharacterized protein with PIN domain